MFARKLSLVSLVTKVLLRVMYCIRMPGSSLTWHVLTFHRVCHELALHRAAIYARRFRVFCVSLSPSYLWLLRLQIAIMFGNVVPPAGIQQVFSWVWLTFFGLVVTFGVDAFPNPFLKFLQRPFMDALCVALACSFSLNFRCISDSISFSDVSSVTGNVKIIISHLPRYTVVPGWYDI